MRIASVKQFNMIQSLRSQVKLPPLNAKEAEELSTVIASRMIKDLLHIKNINAPKQKPNVPPPPKEPDWVNEASTTIDITDDDLPF